LALSERRWQFALSDGTLWDERGLLALPGGCMAWCPMTRGGSVSRCCTLRGGLEYVGPGVCRCALVGDSSGSCHVIMTNGFDQSKFLSGNYLFQATISTTVAIYIFKAVVSYCSPGMITPIRLAGNISLRPAFWNNLRRSFALDTFYSSDKPLAIIRGICLMSLPVEAA
jgi:hypothetical protein